MRAKILAMALVCCAGCATHMAKQTNQFAGEWGLYPPGGGAGWLGVTNTETGLKAEMMWLGGSVLPIPTARMEDGHLVLERTFDVNRKGKDGKPVKLRGTNRMVMVLEGTNLLCTTKTESPGSEGVLEHFKGVRLPPMPPAPVLGRLKFGPAIALFNGKDLTGWKLAETNLLNGWKVRDGILVNDPVGDDGKRATQCGNLRTVAEFEDFSIHVETRVGKGQNSGVYLRGIYEVQVYDTFGKPVDSHNMGAVYSRVTPTASAEKPAGEWQTMDIIFARRHATVVLNGTKIIDNQPVLGPTGGALWPEVDRPGPILLQGDHTGIEYGIWC